MKRYWTLETILYHRAIDLTTPCGACLPMILQPFWLCEAVLQRRGSSVFLAPRYFPGTYDPELDPVVRDSSKTEQAQGVGRSNGNDVPMSPVENAEIWVIEGRHLILNAWSSQLHSTDRRRLMRSVHGYSLRRPQQRSEDLRGGTGNTRGG